MVVRSHEQGQEINYSFNPTLHSRDQTKKKKHNLVKAMIKKWFLSEKIVQNLEVINALRVNPCDKHRNLGLRSTTLGEYWFTSDNAGDLPVDNLLCLLLLIVIR